MDILILMFVLFMFAVGAMTYVYAFRGQARFESLTEYLRKGWPIFAPLNCTLYMVTQKRASKPIMDVKDFPELQILQDNWQVIRDEVLELYKSKALDATGDSANTSYYDIGFRTFYKYGWRKFYLNWYGYTHTSAQKSCPKTVELLSRVPSVNGAMISVLPPQSKLTRHLDPVACSLRYHLGLATPEDDNCYINVDQTSYSWRDGDAFLFDETYLHYVFNNTDKTRLILMCDVNRPTNFIGKIINGTYKILMKITVVPNTNEDKRGLVNVVFSSLAPILAKSKSLKQTNRKAYLALKYSVNTALIALLLLLVAGFIDLVDDLIDYVL
ncbi:MAG: aspartyl/asparaginyl beta-hydroxylase domain-containing protein [Bdellovibrionaceae bacterium]|nr:aspartyl/asparaginyl beta-hydroxylase domain-containing protein [Pseudobdellovibrionaceae bacterium]